MLKGYKCKLFRADGSSKNAVIDISEEYVLRAYKFPEGEIKSKYMINTRQIRDWQFNYKNSPYSWKTSIFAKEKNVFS